MILGWRDKILSNVIHLQSHLKLNISVSDILRQVSRPLIRRDVLASLQLVRNVHGTFSSAQQVTFIHMEKLPAFIQFPCNMLDFQLDSINPAILYPSLQSNMRITELQVVLLSTVNKLAESFVCGWKKVVVLCVPLSYLACCRMFWWRSCAGIIPSHRSADLWPKRLTVSIPAYLTSCWT